MRPLVHPAPEGLTLASVLHALADPARLTLIRALAAHGERNCSEACGKLPRSTLSNHLRILRDAGLVWTRREGTQMISSLRRDAVDGRFPGLLDSVLAAAERDAP